MKWQVSSPEVTIDYISVRDSLCWKIHNCNSARSTPQSSKHLAGVVVVIQKLKFTSFISAGVFQFVVNLENCFAHVNVCQICPLSIMTSVVWFFEFLKNCRFWFLKYFRIKEPSVPVLWKKFRIKESSVLVIAKPLKNRQRISIKTMICSNVLSLAIVTKQVHSSPGYVKILIIDND